MSIKIDIKKFNELTAGEIYEAVRLRQNVFVLEQTCLYPDIDGCDYECWHVMAYDEDDQQVPSGYLRILPAGQTFDTIAIGRVLVREDKRKGGIARKMMEASLEYVQKELGMDRLKLSAQQYLTAFYESLGFNIISDGYLEDGIPHIDMEIVF